MNGKSLPVLERRSRKYYLRAKKRHEKQVINYRKKIVRPMSRKAIVMLYFSPLILMLIVYVLTR